VKLQTISRGSGLFYSDEGHTDAARFVGIFQDVWQAIPYNDKRALTHYWRQEKMRRLSTSDGAARLAERCTKDWALAEVQVFRFPSDPTAPVEQMLGNYLSPHRSGSWPLFGFWACAVEGMDARVLATLLARELAHGFAAATINTLLTSSKRPSRMQAAKLSLCSEEEPEDPTAWRETMANWGFSNSLLDQWCRMHTCELLAT
jgi:hypothetical protein